MGLLTLTQIPCNHVLANEIALNLKYGIGLKKTIFIHISDISPCVFTQISIGRARWMHI